MQPKKPTDSDLLDLLLRCIRISTDLDELKKMAAHQEKIRQDQKRLEKVMAEIHGS